MNRRTILIFLLAAPGLLAADALPPAESLLDRYVEQNKWRTKVVKMSLAITARHNNARKKSEVFTANYPMDQAIDLN